jgi:hypothetical protein
MPGRPTTSSWPFPPSTTRLQLDEQWSFVTKEEKHCDPLDEDDLLAGDRWDCVALDPDRRPVLSVFVGKRLQDNAAMLLEDVAPRRAGVPERITSDGWPGYPEAIKEVFGAEVTPPRTGRPGRPAGPRQEIPPGLN